MKSLANYALFNCVWFAAVLGARDGHLWLGLLAALVMLVIHLALIPDRKAELGYVLCAGLIGALIDSYMQMVGILRYPTSASGWPFLIAPPWIFALWFAFAMLPRLSLAWLRHRPVLGLVLGSIGGPLSFMAGARMGVTEAGSSWTWLWLALEYGLMTPILLELAPPTAPTPPRDVASCQAKPTSKVR